MRKIGAHVSAAGGQALAVERAANIGCNCVQVFAGSPRGWQRPNLAQIDFSAIKTQQAEFQVSPLFTHALYLINLASDDAVILDKSITALQADLHFDSLVGGAGVVVHVGSHQGRGWEAVKGQLLEVIDQILSSTPENSLFLIENSAGQNGKIGSDLTEVAWLLHELEQKNHWVSQKRVGWCFDTCHAHAAGYMLGEKPNQTLLDQAEDVKNYRGLAIETIEQLHLWPTLKLIHVNDSRDPFGAGRDRHDNIGEGMIPSDDLRHLLNVPQLTDTPFITEVPGFDGKGPDQENVGRIMKLVQS